MVTTHLHPTTSLPLGRACNSQVPRSHKAFICSSITTLHPGFASTFLIGFLGTKMVEREKAKERNDGERLSKETCSACGYLVVVHLPFPVL